MRDGMHAELIDMKHHLKPLERLEIEPFASSSCMNPVVAVSVRERSREHDQHITPCRRNPSQWWWLSEPITCASQVSKGTIISLAKARSEVCLQPVSALADG